MEKKSPLPHVDEVRRAVGLFVFRAYGAHPPEATVAFIPPADADIATWLMGDHVERDPKDAPLPAVRSFALRIGNMMYPHMKLRISRPPNEAGYVFSVDCHDAFLQAPAGSPDAGALQELKRHNAAVAAAIRDDWERAGLPTERNYLRNKIEQARSRDNGRESPPGG